jgi:hypothetical protein
LKVWDCEPYVKKLHLDKLEPKEENCIFVGYRRETIGYTFYNKTEGKLFVSKNGTFLEKEFRAKGVSLRKVEQDEILDPTLQVSSSATEHVPELSSSV